MISAGNTKIPSYLTIISKGYQVELELTKENQRWCATKDSNKYFANDLESLLGLITMKESRGNDWLASPSDISDFFNEFSELKTNKK